MLARQVYVCLDKQRKIFILLKFDEILEFHTSNSILHNFNSILQINVKFLRIA